MALKAIKILVALKMVRNITQPTGENGSEILYKDRRKSHTSVLSQIISSGTDVQNYQASIIKKDGLQESTMGDIHVILEAKP